MPGNAFDFIMQNQIHFRVNRKPMRRERLNNWTGGALNARRNYSSDSPGLQLRFMENRGMVMRNNRIPCPIISSFTPATVIR